MTATRDDASATQTARLGFIGTGTITEAVITGLAACAARPREIWVSPRNAQTAFRLAQAHAFVRVGRDNQEIVDRCDVVCLAVRPQIAQAVLRDLRFETRHHILSFIAAWKHDRLKAALPEVSRVVRLAPLPMVAQRIGTTIAYPADAVAKDLFDPLGGTLEAADEDVFDALCAATALMGGYFALLERQASWLQAQGVAYPQARAYLASIHAGLSAAARRSGETFAGLSEEFSTRGGLNEQLTNELSSRGVFDAYATALDGILKRIRGN